MKVQDSILQFIKNGIISQNESFFYSQTRDQSSARLSKWMSDFKSFGLSINDSAILVAILGEITNNSFDHNLGQWIGFPGCVVQINRENDLLIISIADRGQGIVSSLKHSIGQTVPASEILKKAFEERVSGRAPEKRGNGLKFVLKHLLESNNSLICCSQQETYSFGNPKTIVNFKDFPKEFGTFICIEWSLK